MINRLLPLLALIPAAAQAGAPAQLNWRYDEDWSQAHDAGTKHVALNADDTSWISLGVEARARQESFSGNYWGSAPAPDDGYLWLRLMPHADVHVGAARVFIQAIAGKARGVQPAAGPADETGIDLLQGFGDIALPLGDHATLTLRAGRELMPLGSERLVGIRYGPNIPQPFDGVRAILSTGAVRIDAFHMRPVAVGPGDFDDRTSDTKHLDGVYTTFAIADGLKIDAYWLDYRNETASFEQGRGDERRQTYGARFFGKSGALSWNWEAMLQRGHFGGATIRAWSIASETGFAFDALPLKPHVRLRANVASGDKNPADNRLGSFNALFPKGNISASFRRSGRSTS
nr:alginate export family protein [Sphingomonas montanisoli]